MVINRALYRESLLTSLAVLAVLLVLFFFLGVSRLLGDAAQGQHTAGIMLLLIGLELLMRLDILLPLSMYLGLLLTFSRWYRDSEMTVLAACGVGLGRLMRPLLAVALGFTLITGAFSLYLTPWMRATIDRVKAEHAARADVSGLMPGVFTEWPNAGPVLYVDRLDQGAGTFSGVFVSGKRDGRDQVLVARAGDYQEDPATRLRWLQLHQGTLYQGNPGTGDYTIMRFQGYRLRLTPRPVRDIHTGIADLPSGLLRHAVDPGMVAEWHWRLAKPVSVVILAVFALVLAYTDARRGRSANLFTAVLVYFTYSNLVGFGDTLLSQQRVPPGLGLWWVHAIFATLALYLFTRRLYNRPLLPFIGR